MIYAIGYDIVENNRIAKLWQQYGEKFSRRILSSIELEIVASKKDQVRYLAKRFAAKEAFAKACGTGLIAPILLHEISVTNDSFGKPEFVFTAPINQWLAKRNIKHCYLSLSDEKNLSGAMVILEQ